MADKTSGPRPFRFGVVAPVQTDLPTWRDQVRRIADQGYSTILMPDVQQWQPAPGPALAVAATLAPTLRIGTWVYASPLRAPSSVAWEAHSLSVLTEGRFELGIGPGRPGMEGELRQSGLPVATPAERLTQVRNAITSLRELDGSDRRTPVVVAARGPKSWTLATELADTIIAAVTSDSRAETIQRAIDASTTRDVELALHIPVVGDIVAPFMAGPDTDAAALQAADSLLALPNDPSAAVEEILKRREEGGFSYFVIGANAAEALAPAVAKLTGH
ncbi:LLM class flavin-dependent oxidoreductase [Kribbella sp. NPDC056861]|uniref:LLM class flavin-dependent oxidoreductase n=1 Tax=Kribbella sp. NPDC056861 TaxID=3154857 RepID=UPI00342D768B